MKITQDMINLFRWATQDENPIHEHGIVLGFQSESILKYMYERENGHQIYSITTDFRKIVTAEDDLDPILGNNFAHGTVDDQEALISRYGPEPLEAEHTQGIGRRFLITPGDALSFFTGLGMEINTLDMLVASYSSSLLLEEMRMLKTEGDILYARHSIQFTEIAREVNVGSHVQLSYHRGRSRKPLYSYNIMGTENDELLFRAQLLLVDSPTPVLKR